jgi:hypothetical protein
MHTEEITPELKAELDEIRDLDLTPEVEESLLESRSFYEEIEGRKLTLREVYNICFDNPVED